MKETKLSTRKESSLSDQKNHNYEVFQKVLSRLGARIIVLLDYKLKNQKITENLAIKYMKQVCDAISKCIRVTTEAVGAPDPDPADEEAKPTRGLQSILDSVIAKTKPQ